MQETNDEIRADAACYVEIRKIEDMEEEQSK